MVRFVMACALAVSLTACAGDDAPAASGHATTASTVGVPVGALRYVFDHEGIVMRPPADGEQPVWTRADAIAAITRTPFFEDTSPKVWFGTYNGQLGWLAIADGLTLAPSMGAPTRGYEVAVFADDTAPAHAISGVASTGGAAPRPNAAPPRHRYNGRLHLTFVTPSGGPIGGSLAEWMMQPAIGVHPRLAPAEAEARLEATPFRAMSGTRVYFGLFTGLDNQGTLHTRTPAWMIFGTGYATHVDGGPCCNHTVQTFAHPLPNFGAAVVSDTVGDDGWASAGMTAAGHPLVD